MSRCPNCDTPLHITRAASPVIESESAYTYRTGVLMQQTPPKSSETEKVPTPASDSVKGEHCPHSATTEKDRHGRSIIARNDFAMVVECKLPTNLCRFNIVDQSCTYWYLDDEDRWIVDEYPNAGIYLVDAAMKLLPLAAATPLPTAKETPSGNGLGYSESDEIAIALDSLDVWRKDLDERANQIGEWQKTLTADLERYRVRLANLEGKVNK